VSEIDLGDDRASQRKRDHENIKDQLKRAFPFPRSGRFEDLLSAIDEADRSRRNSSAK
jgi:hypothetical protein